jgi:ribosome-binding protein aMBF1 (putative translation factor)
MSHQDWNTITFNNISNQIKKENSKKTNSNKTSNPEKTHLEAPKDLGKLISQARTANNKNQKQLSSEIGISQQILARWESNREFPNNAEIAKLEKILKTKLPRCKRVNNEE